MGGTARFHNYHFLKQVRMTLSLDDKLLLRQVWSLNGAACFGADNAYATATETPAAAPRTASSPCYSSHWCGGSRVAHSEALQRLQETCGGHFNRLFSQTHAQPCSPGTRETRRQAVCPPHRTTDTTSDNLTTLVTLRHDTLKDTT